MIILIQIGVDPWPHIDSSIILRFSFSQNWKTTLNCLFLWPLENRSVADMKCKENKTAQNINISSITGLRPRGSGTTGEI